MQDFHTVKNLGTWSKLYQWWQIPEVWEISPLRVAPVEMTVGRVWSVSLRHVSLRREISPFRFVAVEMTVEKSSTGTIRFLSE